ncbi:MAG: sigma-54-dependent Fis family transcriptional regulator [Candidatus Zixiibacteriota bacterium]|nr:MAG: sigma-54-dependent Fis family transcriptional regulator [candidate division Zixibacteria bacterium]
MNKTANTRILVIDDETSMGEFMKIMLGKEGYSVSFETSAQHALRNFSQSQSDPQKRYDLMITDLMMPEMSGLDLLTKAQKIDPDIDVIVMTAFGSIDTAVEALKKGAHDYITKPFKVEEIKIAIKKAVENKKIKKENISLKETIKSGFDSFIGNSPSIVKIKKHAAKAASSDVTVLITGESGTGKEVLARAIHAESRRANGPFLSINSAALPETLLESELFGHVKGSFTGAVKDKTGLFTAAAAGTFFLDEIGETSPAIQAKLLRVLEDREVTPVGATKAFPVDVRLIAATNASLQEMVDQGSFRSDLFYRLNVFSLHIPPLKERIEDIEILAAYFIKRHCARMKIDELSLSDDALEVLKSYSWPGNIRQLENMLERTLMLAKGKIIEIDDLPEEILKAIESKPDLIQNITRKVSVSPDLETMEKAYIHYVLHQTGWNKSKAAKILGIDLSTLYRKMDRYSIPKKP